MSTNASFLAIRKTRDGGATARTASPTPMSSSTSSAAG
jgi:hypothetical protein